MAEERNSEIRDTDSSIFDGEVTGSRVSTYFESVLDSEGTGRVGRPA